MENKVEEQNVETLEDLEKYLKTTMKHVTLLYKMQNSNVIMMREMWERNERLAAKNTELAKRLDMLEAKLNQ